MTKETPACRACDFMQMTGRARITRNNLQDVYKRQEVARAAEWMNNYPRRVLGWKSAGAVFSKYMAA